MDIKKSNKLPEGVGKKIVEALKQQSTGGFSAEDNTNYEDADFDTQQESGEYGFIDTEVNPNEFDVIDLDNLAQEEVSFSQNAQTPIKSSTSHPQYQHLIDKFNVKDEALTIQSYKEETKQIPEANNLLTSNINVLIKLISQLPAGVTKQTGAQIIRQTIEAMGISMNKVLTEAQYVQENITQSIRSNLNKVEEHKHSIKALESQVKDYRTQSEHLEDLISLFILSDK